MNNIGRRQLAAAGACAGLGMILADRFLGGAEFHDRRKPRSHVAVVEADCYEDRLEDLLLPSIRALAGHLPGKTILLKPNLVEDLPGPVNTHPAVVRAAANCFFNLGAKRVIVGEGPGNQRDSETVLVASGLVRALRSIGVQFVDLNRDALSPVKLKTNFSGLKRLWLPQTLLAADFVVSIPKVKTHHWAGATLGLKNMFGVVPGAKYGWPKNLLHWYGIDPCIVDIAASIRIDLVIADGILAMEGDGPLLGRPRKFNRVVISDDPVAADATCARLMGLEPARIPYLKMAGGFLGNLDEERIEFLDGHPSLPNEPFAVLAPFRHLLR
jgi:uncharacterized protein (DUF362 family)